jgi:SAM-dependent methyltransferase
MADIRQQILSVLKRRQRKSWDSIKWYCPEYISKSKHFNELVMPYLGSEVEMVDLGCGRGLETAVIYKDYTRHSFGLDISESVLQNQTIHKPLVGSVYDIPLPEACVDLAVSQELLEHLEFPQRMFDEVSRILRPRGIFAIMTPNLWFPSTIISWLTPYSFHKFATRAIYETDSADIFPTWYRANTLKQLRRLGGHAGLDEIYHEYFQCNPGLFSFSPLLTRLELAYFHLVSRFQGLGFLRDIIIAFYRKLPR